MLAVMIEEVVRDDVVKDSAIFKKFDSEKQVYFK